MTTARRRGLGPAVATLAVSNAVTNRLWPRAYLPWNVAVTGALLTLARRCGVSWYELGLDPTRLGAGFRLGAIAAGSVGLVYGAALALPTTRGAFVDTRTTGRFTSALFEATVRVPLGTVLLEEVAFRGVLPVLVGGSRWRATLVSSGLFGLWHVLPSTAMSANAAFGDRSAVTRAGLAVAATSVAGVALTTGRDRSGHLAAPMLAHVATNSLGVLIAWWMTRR